MAVLKGPVPRGDRASTAVIGTVTAPGHLAGWILHSERDDVQTLLASRPTEARERNHDPALDMGFAALQKTATGLRSTTTELHPQVLDQLDRTRGAARTVAGVRIPHQPGRRGRGRG